MPSKLCRCTARPGRSLAWPGRFSAHFWTFLARLRMYMARQGTSKSEPRMSTTEPRRSIAWPGTSTSRPGRSATEPGISIIEQKKEKAAQVTLPARFGIVRAGRALRSSELGFQPGKPAFLFSLQPDALALSRKNRLTNRIAAGYFLRYKRRQRIAGPEGGTADTE